MDGKQQSARVIVIRRSCVTGKPVWIYRGKSESHARIAYWKACKKEITLEKNWPNVVAARAAEIQRLIDRCMEAVRRKGGMTDRQQAAAKALKKMAESPPAYYSAFYNHIRTERRRRKRDREIRRKMRERENERESSL